PPQRAPGGRVAARIFRVDLDLEAVKAARPGVRLPGPLRSRKGPALALLHRLGAMVGPHAEALLVALQRVARAASVRIAREPRGPGPRAARRLALRVGRFAVVGRRLLVDHDG